MELETIIGLEIHVQLKTKSKMFCSCNNNADDVEPNKYICPVCTGQPGTLPVLNSTALRWGIKAALAMNCQILSKSKFDRKNYFYPDLPKGYQISQYDLPLAQNGFYIIKAGEKSIKVGIVRVHLEEDSAKLTHPAGQKYSLVDFNRSGTPLLEIVTEPDFRQPHEAKIFLQSLRLLMRYLKISDADMEKGHLRCDANISLRPIGDTKLYTKTEIKNMNSFKAVENALSYEIERQTDLWLKNQIPNIQTTRGWNEQKGETVEQRVKEAEADYRYFPEPDIPPLAITKELVDRLKSELCELPEQRKIRYLEDYSLSMREIDFLVENPILGNYVEGVISELRAWFIAEKPRERGKEFNLEKDKLTRLASSWIINKLVKLLYDSNKSARDLKISQENFAEFIKLIYEERINSRNAQEIMSVMFKTGRDPSDIIEEKNLWQLGTEEDLELIVEKVINDNPKPVADYKKGKLQVLQYLIGQVMKETCGRGNPEIINHILVHKLK